MSIRSSRSLAAALFALSLATGAVAQSSADSARVARLAALGRLWGAVKYFHPAVATGAIDWDSALVATIPRVRAAASKAEYAAAVNDMLSSIGDAATRVVPDSPPTESASSAPASTRWAGDSTLVIAIPDPTDYNGAIAALNRAQTDFARAPRVIFDLRTGGVEREPGYLEYIFGSSTVGGLLTATPITAPGVRSRVYSGFPPQVGGTSGGYWSGFVIRAGDVSMPAAAAARPRRIGFLVDEHSDLPPVALALQQAGIGVIAAEGRIPEIAAGGASWTTTLADSVRVTVRVGELVTADGSVDVRPDTVVGASAAGGDAALAAAFVLMRTPGRSRLPVPARAGEAQPPAERAYPDMHFPALEYRLLAAFRYWTAIEYFFPYKHLMGEDWNQVLVSMIPRFEAAADSLGYALAVAELVTRIHDSHGGVGGSSALRGYFGQVPPAVKVRYVEGVPVVTEVSSDSSVGSSGIRAGDVVLRIDGETAAARRARLEPYIASSTPQALDRVVAGYLLNGPEGSTAIIQVRGTDGREREVRLVRRAALLPAMRWTRSGPTWQVLAGNIGYVDLEKLTVPQVDSMFDALRETRAIIFDNRSYPQGTAWAIAPRLTEQQEVAGARFQRPLVMSPDSLEWSVYSFIQRLPATTKWRYLKPTVMLVDERTISQAEHTGLFFEAANGTKFIGSPTMGANGDVTTVLLPGGISARFTGHDVRHADGRQLQRMGLQPHVLVRPTVAGIRAGRDEVLERAVRYIESGR